VFSNLVSYTYKVNYLVSLLYASKEDMEKKGISLNQYEINHLADLINLVISKKSRKMNKLREYLKSIATLFVKLNLPIV
jgi:hypothetical protein